MAYFVFSGFLSKFEDFAIPSILVHFITWLAWRSRCWSVDGCRRCWNLIRRWFLEPAIHVLVEREGTKLFLVFRLVPPGNVNKTTTTTRKRKFAYFTDIILFAISSSRSHINFKRKRLKLYIVHPGHFFGRLKMAEKGQITQHAIGKPSSLLFLFCFVIVIGRVVRY